MQTIQTANIPAEQIDRLDRFAASEVSPEMRDVLYAVSRCMRAGVELAAVSADSALTPNQVADRLGMSRTHLYKLLDRGQIAFHRVGRDRRVLLADVVAFEQQRQHDRRELAKRFATQQQTLDAADEEIADTL